MQCEVVYNGNVIFWKRLDSVCHAFPYLCSLPAGGKSTSKERVRRYIKGLLELAHSCYGLSLHCFLGLAEFRYSWIRFMWTFKTFEINFLLLLDSCVIKKNLYIRRDGNWKKVVWAGGGIVRGHQADSVHFVCTRACVFVGRRVGWVGIIRHQMLL